MHARGYKCSVYFILFFCMFLKTLALLNWWRELVFFVLTLPIWDLHVFNYEFPGIQEESLLEMNSAKQSLIMKTVVIISKYHIILPISDLHLTTTLPLQSQLNILALSVLQDHVSVLNLTYLFWSKWVWPFFGPHGG